jgi:AcrR family transcriptional regulator
MFRFGALHRQPEGVKLHRPMNASLKPRRKPSQSRAWMTSGAIQDAFVQLLVEHGYEKVSMRDIAGVAGVGLGTLYLYFPGKDSIAAVAIRGRMRRLAAAEKAAPAAAGARTLAEIVGALVQTHVCELLGQAAEWTALLFLERRVSSAEAYRELYKEFVHLFRDAFAQASDWPANCDAERHAYNAFSILYALAEHALLVQDICPEADELVRDAECAVNGYFERALQGPRAAGHP